MFHNIAWVLKHPTLLLLGITWRHIPQIGIFLCSQKWCNLKMKYQRITQLSCAIYQLSMRWIIKKRHFNKWRISISVSTIHRECFTWMISAVSRNVMCIWEKTKNHQNLFPGSRYIIRFHFISSIILFFLAGILHFEIVEWCVKSESRWKCIWRSQFYPLGEKSLFKSNRAMFESASYLFHLFNLFIIYWIDNVSQQIENNHPLFIPKAIVSAVHTLLNVNQQQGIDQDTFFCELKQVGEEMVFLQHNFFLIIGVVLWIVFCFFYNHDNNWFFRIWFSQIMFILTLLRVSQRDL